MIKSPDSGGQDPRGDTVASTRVDVGAVAQAFHDGVKIKTQLQLAACTMKTRGFWHRTCPRAKGVPPSEPPCKHFLTRRAGRSS